MLAGLYTHSGGRVPTCTTRVCAGAGRTRLHTSEQPARARSARIACQPAQESNSQSKEKLGPLSATPSMCGACGRSPYGMVKALQATIAWPLGGAATTETSMCGTCGRSPYGRALIQVLGSPLPQVIRFRIDDAM